MPRLFWGCCACCGPASGTPSAAFRPPPLQGTFYFAEPSNCGRGQILTVTVDCSPGAPSREPPLPALTCRLPEQCCRSDVLTDPACPPLSLQTEPKAKEKKEKEEEAAAEEEAPAAALMVGDSSDASAVAAAEAPTDTHTWAHEAAAAAPAPATHDGETPVVAMGSIDPLDKDAA